MKKKVLLTGGLGYIGSHTAVKLIEAGFEVVIIDNLSNSSRSVLDSLQKITGSSIPFFEMNILNTEDLDSVFKKTSPDAVIHFAALKAVGESVSKPLAYYTNNICGLLSVLEAMKRNSTNHIVFSSSATVYGEPDVLPIPETAPLKATNPYGWTKLMCEQILRDLDRAEDNLHVAILRYFNPVGAHESGLIGESPNGVPNNLMPYIVQVAAGLREKLSIYGDDYDTRDGTGVRDYIHVDDLAVGHVKTLEYMLETHSSYTYNLGTGNGYSVLEMVEMFEKVNNVTIKRQIVGRRPGDIASCYADVEKVRKELGWKTEKTLEDMVRDAWNYQQKKLSMP